MFLISIRRAPGILDDELVQVRAWPVVQFFNVPADQLGGGCLW